MLTNVAVQNALGRGQDYKLYDSGGLFLFVTKTGTRSWRFKYRLGGKEKRLVFGRYPELSLRAARDKRDAARVLLRDGKDPALAERRRRLIGDDDRSSTFEVVGRLWHEKKKTGWKPVHSDDVITSLERDLFPLIGSFAVDQIDEPMMLAALQKVENRGAYETAHRLRQRAERIFRFAKGLGFPNSNPAIEIKDAMISVPPSRKWPALLEMADIRALLSSIDQAHCQPITRLASRFLALVAQRPGMVRFARWADFFDLDDARSAMWRIPADRMKLELHLREDEAFDHEVPLSRQAVELLRITRKLSGGSDLVFPSLRDSSVSLSENAIGYLYNREGYAKRHVPHGWRSSFSTIMNARAERNCTSQDRLVIDRLIIDLMLAHRGKGMSAAELRYNRAAYMPRRRELAQEWADLILNGAVPTAALLDGLKRHRVRPVKVAA